ncbi:MAG: integration host factor subunit beta [Bdellovibrionaceae bacterium]|nr:integration host factor subunit beta [Pseudobdellovibrionaceae bacterium]MDW8189867.1 HU family DNA-binding protein [Pseudobdellovibrionaceae bacterium]
MTKNDLINKLAEKANIPKPKAQAVVDSIFNGMVKALIKNDRVEIRGFGTIAIRQYGARTGRNPNSGRLIRVLPKKLPHYKMAKELKNLLIQNYRQED